MRARILVPSLLVSALLGCGSSSASSVSTGDGGADATPQDGESDQTLPDAPAEGGPDGSVSDASAEVGSDASVDAASDAPGDAPRDAPGSETSDATSEAAVPSCGDAGADGGPIVLAQGLGTPFWLAVDSSNVYWTETNGGRVMECGIADCCASPTALATNEPYPSGITALAGNVFWIDQGPSGPGTGNVASCAASGCNGTPTNLSGGQGGLDIAISGSTLFWSNNYSSGAPQAGRLMTCSLASGCAATTMAFTSNDVDDAGTPLQPIGVAVDATSVYWADYGAGLVMSANQNGSGMRTLATGQVLVRDLVVDATNVYWVNYQPATVSECAIAGCNGTPTVLYTQSTGNTGSIAVDATDVYFTTDKAVMKCAIGGCNGTPTVLVSSSDPNTYFTDITVDGTTIYWLDASHGTNTGRLLMLPK